MNSICKFLIISLKLQYGLNYGFYPYHDQAAVVTGSYRGIGLEIVKKLCFKIQGDTYLTSRNDTLGSAAVQELNKQGYNPQYHQLDITDRESIQNFKNFIMEKYIGLDVLVNNAGIAYKVNSTVPFAIQARETIKVNYFGLRNVCDILYPIIKPHGRIVHVSSSSGHLTRIPGIELRKKFASESLTVKELDDLMLSFVTAAEENRHEQEGWPNSAYVVSKVGVSKLAFIHQREFFKSTDRPDIIVNAVHPGYVPTEMSGYNGFMTPEEGANVTIYAATLEPNVDRPKGAYLWYDGREIDWVNGTLP